MKTIITILFLAMAVPCFAGNPYMAARGVGVQAVNGMEPGAEMALGYRLNEYFRAEAAGAYFENIDIDVTQDSPDARLDPIEITGEASAQVYTVNGILDIPTGTDFTPYAMAGVGFVKFSVDITGSSTVRPFPGFSLPVSESTSWSQTNRVWTVGAGCSYSLGAGWFLEAFGQYYDMGKINLDELTYRGQSLGLEKEPLRTIMVGAGIRWEIDW